MFPRRCCFIAATAAFSFFWPQPLAAADSIARSLLAKHRSFVGWQLGDGSVRTLRLSREYTDGDANDVQRVTEYRVGIVYRNHYVFPKRANTVEDAGFTGNIFWSSNANGFTTPIYGELARLRFSYAMLFNEGTTALDAVDRGIVTLDGKALERIRVSVPHADPIDIDVDTATGAYVRAVIDPGGDEETTVRILSYAQLFGGKKTIGSFRSGDDSAGTSTYTKIEPNVPIGDADLHPPAAQAAWNFANPRPFPIAVTHTRVLVNASVNGIDGRFILDTGANTIFLNDAFADRAKVAKLDAGGTAVSLYGAQRSSMRKAATISIGGNTLSNVILETQDFTSRDYRGLDRQNYDGLLGYDIFAGAVVKLDLHAQTMQISDPSSAAQPPDGVGILTDTSLWVPMIPMTLNRSIAVNAMLDTGDPATIVFGPDLLYKYHLRMARNVGFRAGFGSIECGNIDTLQIGPITYGGEAACKLDTNLLSGRRILVGLDFLRNFTAVFDYPRGRLFLQPLR